MRIKIILIALLSLIFIIMTKGYSQPVVNGFNVYYGSLHNHSNVSDGQGTPDEAYDYAKNVAQLDFFGLSDHANLMNAAEWLLIKTTANLYNEDNIFAAFYGFEWTTYFSYGHVTVVNTDDYCSNTSPTNTFNGLLNWLNVRNGAAFFNHPGWDVFAFNEFDHFTDPPSEKFVGIELWNDHDGFSKYYYNDGFYGNDGNKGYFDEALIRQWKIGAAGGDDNHTATWGTATPFRMGVLAQAKTRTDIFNAIMARRFFSTLDNNLVVSFQINNNEMGSTIPGGSWETVIEAFDSDNEIITNVDLFKNGVLIQSWAPGITHPEIITTLACADADYFYTKITQADGDEAISSPVFISGVAQAPQIAITYPANNAVFVAGSDISIVADAADTDGIITNVEFYYDGSLIGEDNIPPYTITWTSTPEGNYLLTAIAYDDTGLETVSEGVMVVIEPQIPLLAVTPSNIIVPSNSGITEFDVTSNIDWTAESNQPWCAVTFSGSGNGIITASFQENLSLFNRIAEITVTASDLLPVVVTVTQESAAEKNLNLSLLLQGLYNESGTMRTAKDESGLPRWDENVADRISVALHNGNNYEEVIFTVSDVDLLIDGSANIIIPAIYNESYYIVIRHRNSIETVSAEPVSFYGAAITYNFNVNTKAFGNNMAITSDGWWTIYGGDVSQDGIIDTGDMTPVDNASRIFLSGYLYQDVNGDGFIDTADMTIIDNNASQFIGAMHP